MKLVVHEQNKGVSYSYNEAVNLASADVIVIQGGDDRSLPGRVEEQVRSLSRSKTILNFSQPKVIDSLGQGLPKEAAPEFFSFVDSAKIFEHLYFVGNFICAPSVAIRKIDYELYGGFNSANSYLQDYQLWLQLASVGDFVMNEAPLVEYRKHERNLSRDSVSRSIAYTSRFDAEMDYVLGATAKNFDRTALLRLGRHIGLPDDLLDSTDSDLLLSLLQLSHSDITQVRRGLALLMELIASKGEIDFLCQFGIDNQKLNEYARICDHKNSSSKASFEYRIENLLV
jgi:glycosyltransferase involved in cell wall biosynthesis